jgi:hypothetical protein
MRLLDVKEHEIPLVSPKQPQPDAIENVSVRTHAATPAFFSRVFPTCWCTNDDLERSHRRHRERERRMTARYAAVIAAVAIAVVAATTGAAHAAPTAGICKSFSASGAGKIQWSAIGNVTCQQAKPWLVKILSKHGVPDAQAKVTNGPTGFHCRATNNAKGIPSVGACYTGTIKFPKNGFQWFG